jgi:hypothetical protein
MLVQERRGDDPTVSRLGVASDPAARLGRPIRRRLRRAGRRNWQARMPADTEAFSDDRSELRYDLRPLAHDVDVVNLHWVARFLDYREAFAALAEDVPVVWTLHDMNLITGGCHYDQGCGRFSARCGACPQIGSMRERDASRRIWRRKRRLFGSLAPERVRLVPFRST